MLVSACGVGPFSDASDFYYLFIESWLELLDLCESRRYGGFSSLNDSFFFIIMADGVFCDCFIEEEVG